MSSTTETAIEIETEMTRTATETETETVAELEGWEWQYGIFQSSSLIAVYMIPMLLVIISIILYSINNTSKKNQQQQQQGTTILRNRGSCVAAQSRGSGQHRRRRPILNGDAYDVHPSLSLFSSSWFRHAFRIETSSLQVQALLEKEVENYNNHKQNQNQNQNNSSPLTPITINSYEYHRSGPLYKIHPMSMITEDDIRKVHHPTNPDHNDNDDNNNNDNNGDGVVLFFRLASIFVSSGMSTIESEQLLMDVARALKLPSMSLLNVGLSEITAQFSLGTVVNISCSTAAFYQLSLLSRTQQLASHIINNNNSVTVPAILYLRVLDEMEEDRAADPYGWLIRLLAIYIVSVFAPLAVYDGYYINLVWSSIIGVAIIGILLLLQSNIVPTSVGDRWECPLVSFVTGLLSSVLWQLTAHNNNNSDSLFHTTYTDDGPLDQCIASYTIGVLLIWFPGSTLVYGAYEVFMGSYTNGGVRLIKGIVSAMVIALFYTFGWQYWGMNWASNETMLGVPTNLYNTTGAIASLPPSTNCKSPNPPYELPWYISEVVFAIPLNAATMVVFNIRLQDAGGVFLVAQATYCIQGAIKNCGGESDGLYCGIPTYVTTLFIAFFAGCLSEINAYLTGFSKYGSMLAVIFVLAPGASCVKAILGAFHRIEGDALGNESSIWENVVLEGVAYAIGFYLAFDVLSPIVTFLSSTIRSSNSSISVPNTSKSATLIANNSADNNYDRNPNSVELQKNVPMVTTEKDAIAATSCAKLIVDPLIQKTATY